MKRELTKRYYQKPYGSIEGCVERLSASVAWMKTMETNKLVQNVQARVKEKYAWTLTKRQAVFALCAEYGDTAKAVSVWATPDGTFNEGVLKWR